MFKKMVDIQASDYHNFIDILLEFKMIPEDLHLPIPDLFSENNVESIELMALLVKLIASSY
jgi:hypothetical protein